MKIFIFYANAGHGHKKVAEVLAETFQDRGLSKTQVRVFDALDFTPSIFKNTYPDIYFRSVKHTPGLWGWFYEHLDLSTVYLLLQPFRHRANRFMGRRLLEWVRKEKPDAIICTHFFSAELFASAKLRKEISSTILTVITDFLPHTFWVNPGTDCYWVMSEEARTELAARGVPPEKICAGGIPVGKKFKPTGKKKEILAKYGLEENRLTLLLTSGSFGLGPQHEILKALENFGDKIQCFVVCGNNLKILKTLGQIHFSFPVRLFGFVDFMDELMEASDLTVAKPGGATTTEALAKDLPIIILDPIPGQESRNANVLTNRNAAFAIQKPEQIKTIVQAIFDHPGLLASKATAIKMLAKPNAADDLVSFVLKS